LRFLQSALDAAGQVEGALQEAQGAIDLLVELQAELELSRARALVRALSKADVNRGEPGTLTVREIEVLRLVAGGSNNAQIAEKLFVSEHTVHRHLANIFSKLDVSSRAAAVAQAVRRGLLS
jgi:DNA-binding NarL/FixJ family response regulator